MHVTVTSGTVGRGIKNNMSTIFRDVARRENKKAEGKEVNTDEEEKLLKACKKFYRMSKKGEETRMAQDRKGTKLREGQHWSQGAAPGTNLITSNNSASLYEKLVDSVVRNKPVPEVSAYDTDDDEAAGVLEAAIMQVWEDNFMQQKMKQAAIQVGFTRPVLLYIEWDRAGRGGIGMINTRTIPAYRSIIDNRHTFLTDMEFSGFKEYTTRRKLIKLFPNKADAIEEATEAHSDSLMDNNANPLRSDNANVSDGSFPNTIGSISSNAVSAPGGTTWSQIGRDGVSASSLDEEMEVLYLWIKDSTPIHREKVKMNSFGRPIKKLIRDELTGEIQFDTKGFTVVQGPFGPINQPNLIPKTEDVMEDVIEEKYKNYRHICFLPMDNLILWDVDWDAPLPLVSLRDNFALDGYWTVGLAQRLIKVQHAKNIALTILVKNITHSLTGTYLASVRSGIKDSKLIPQPGQVYMCQNIDDQSIKRFPTAQLDPGLIQMLQIFKGEMMDLLNISPMQTGQAPGRVDSRGGLDTVLSASSDNMVALSQHIEDSISEWAKIVMWFIQNYYNHEHFVEIIYADGVSEWKSASALAVRGQYAVRVDTGVGLNHSEAAQYARALEAYTQGVYPLPTLAQKANIQGWKKALKLKGELLKRPDLQYLLGASVAPPASLNKAASKTAASTRSHHSLAPKAG